MKLSIKIFNMFSYVLIYLILTCLNIQSFAQTPPKKMKYWTQEEWDKWEKWNHRVQLLKSTGAADRREGVMDGNKIRTVFYNYGSVGRPNTEPSIEWPKESGHGYAYEFGPIIGALVVDIHGDTIPIISEALIDGGDRSPSGKVWGWQPLPQYLNTNSPTPAMSNNPDSWPLTVSTTNPFFNPDFTSDLDKFLWPGIDGLGKISADLEAFWVMDDRDNDEFEYYPFINDSSRRGLGIQLNCRLMQFSASLAEDIIFYIIEIENVSDKRLDKVVAGMFGDPHIGGPGDFSDDYAGFDKDYNMVYSYDKPGSSNDYGIPYEELGWLGFKFLESPKDSLGNQLGLTSMAAPIYGTAGGTPAFDDVMWDLLKPGTFTDIAQEKDNVFLFGSGYFSLDPGEKVRFSIAIIMGKGRDDLYSNADIAQEIYDLNYKFTKAPDPPIVTAVPGDGEVTLYWDTSSEQSFDEFFQAYDFQGYKIYKSTDKGQTWGPIITDAFGKEIGFKPLAQFDKIDDVSGLFPYDKDGVKFYLGNNSGLVHTFTDKNVINGVTYYYAVTAYDSGYPSKGVLPVESGKFPGQNMVSVMPTPRVPGFENAQVNVNHIEGISTATLKFNVLDPQKIVNNTYDIIVNAGENITTSVSIINAATGDTVINNFNQLNGQPILFDGLIGFIYDEPGIFIVDSLSGWLENSKSNLSLDISLYSGGVRIPKDMEVRFFSYVADTSVLVSPKPINFQVWNVTDNEQMEVIFFDRNGNDIVDIGDRLVPIIYVNDRPKGVWQVAFNAPAGQDTILPQPGDIIKIFVSKPFTNDDSYQLQTLASTVNKEKAKKDFLQNVAVIPNPYIVTSSFEVAPPTVFSAGRGERRVYFTNLPPKCTIRIYTLNGELIREIHHESTLFNSMEPWDLLSEEGLEISYGIYIYHVDAGEYGKKIGKLAIIK
ncbi:hypothetical protein Calab_3298 [Caldithrix abyssi DSM 13497]|uniref:T9SS type A sorting domain-containing protein n=1 Tax=Caldithrix abyssi DSM 13497 TaxID=880073 RepID=H1XVK2_CALAY|nr:hypothetical protein [Caldithrix abyssi]APF18943.1 hypothetical protein Cabys_2194 [Caldithrix abyssi DSM 13497]EHO42902.1 hypothetical protein Calab_3298 [Caldithrix abyssi DSM 13497]